MSRLNETVARVEYDGLIADVNPPADVFAVKIKAGEGELKRGTVLALSDDLYVVMADLLTANCILAEDTDASEETSAIAYRTGNFAEDRLIVKEGYTLTARDKEALRDVGILITGTMEY